MNNQKAMTEVLNTIYEVSNIERTASCEAVKERLINYKAERLLEKLKSLREEDEDA